MFFIQCDSQHEKIICTIENRTLHLTELETIIEQSFSNLPPKQAKEKAIQKWSIDQQIDLYSAEYHPNIHANKTADLQLFELENLYINKHLDTTISEEEILHYYNKHRENYVTKAYIVKALYMKIPDTIASIVQPEKYYMLKNDKDYVEIKNIGNLYATSFYLEQNRWIYFNDLMREIPFSAYQKENLIKNKKQAIFKINNEIHYLNILDYKTKNISSPLQIENKRIRHHILRIRIKDWREKAKNIILNDVKKKYPVHFN